MGFYTLFGKTSLKQVKIKIYWLDEECSAKVTGRATRVDSGQVVVERTTDGHASLRQNAENKVPQSRRDHICASAFRTAADRLVPFFMDYTDNVALEFQKVDDAGTTERALELLKLSKLADAEKMLEQVVKSNGNRSRRSSGSRRSCSSLRRVSWPGAIWGNRTTCMSSISRETFSCITATSNRSPHPFAAARSLALHPSYAWVEVYADYPVCVRLDGTPVEVR